MLAVFVHVPFSPAYSRVPCGRTPNVRAHTIHITLTRVHALGSPYNYYNVRLELCRRASTGFGPLFLAPLTAPNGCQTRYAHAHDMAFVPSHAWGAMATQSRGRSESMKCFNEVGEQGPF